MGLFIPEGKDTSVPPKCKVEMENRPVQNKIMAVIFSLALFAQIVLAIVCMASVPNCRSGVDDDALADFGSALEKYSPVFAGCIILVLLLGVAWIFLLQKFASVITWGTLIVESLGGVALGVWLLTEDASEPAATVFIFVAVCVGIMIYKKKAVQHGAEMLRQAAFCISANPGLVGMSTVIQVVLIVYGVIINAGLMSSFHVGSCETFDVAEGLQFVPAKWADGARTFMGLMLVWVLFTLMMMRAYMVGGVAAMWYWGTSNRDDENYIKNKSCKTMSWALSSSFGTVASAGLIVAIVDRLARWTKSTGWTIACCCNPIFWAFKVLMCYLKEMVNALTKFCLIMAAITGEDFFVSVALAFTTLKGRFSTLFAVDYVAKVVLYSGAMVFSLLVWFMSWTIAAAAVDKHDPFEYMAQDAMHARLFGEGEDTPMFYTTAITVLLWIFSTLLFYFPLLGILVIVLAGQFIFQSTFGYAFAFGLFVGCLANYIFTFFANTILDTTAALFCIVEIDRKNGYQHQGDASEAGSPAAVGQFYRLLSGGPSPEVQVAPEQQALQMQPMAAQPVAVAIPVAQVAPGAQPVATNDPPV